MASGGVSGREKERKEKRMDGLVGFSSFFVSWVDSVGFFTSFFVSFFGFVNIYSWCIVSAEREYGVENTKRLSSKLVFYK